MIKKTTIGLLILFIGNSLFAQNDVDTITYQKTFGGYSYEQYGTLLTIKDMLGMMTDYPEAAKYIKKAKRQADFAMALGYGGGALIGFPLGMAISGGQPEWPVVGVGAGLVAIAIPVIHSVNKNALKAVDIYNKQIQAEVIEANAR